VTALRTLERGREDFISGVSHDLRTPLTAIHGNAQLIQRVAEHPEIARARADAIILAARQMNAMIQDLVDSARLEAGQLPVEAGPIDVAAFVREVADRMSLAF